MNAAVAVWLVGKVLLAIGAAVVLAGFVTGWTAGWESDSVWPLGMGGGVLAGFGWSMTTDWKRT